jgi:hypothetical protein
MDPKSADIKKINNIGDADRRDMFTANHLIIFWSVTYPLSQVKEAVDPNNVVVNFKSPVVTFGGDPQSKK